MTDDDLVALVSTRLCHDLISPIGAIGNGVELLTQLSPTPSPELDLIADSVNSAAAKLRFFRIAFGGVPAGSTAPMAEVRSAIATLYQGRSSVTVEAEAADLPRSVVRLMLLALLCQEKCLPLGGQSRVVISQTHFSIDTTAPRTRDMAELWAVVDAPETATEIAPGDVQFQLLGRALAEAGVSLNRDIGTDRISISATGLTP